ncbi:MAG: acetyltransferase [Chloroflexota bacterium]|jgi:acetyltransferase|nr:acetyltransferase [Chloroflexota bacterium]
MLPLPALSPRRDSAPAVEIRPVRSGDAAGLADFYRALSNESRRRRFLGTCLGLPPSACLALCGADHQHSEGLIAALRQPGQDDGRIVGHLCLVPDDEGGLELAIAVADELQGCGIGRRLVAAAASWARSRGIGAVHASCFADNGAVLHLLSTVAGEATVRSGGPSVLEVELLIDRAVGRATAG